MEARLRRSFSWFSGFDRSGWEELTNEKSFKSEQIYIIGWTDFSIRNFINLWTGALTGLEWFYCRTKPKSDCESPYCFTF
jgi:hypothetical protein